MKSFSQIGLTIDDITLLNNKKWWLISSIKTFHFIVDDGNINKYLDLIPEVLVVLEKLRISSSKILN